MEFVANARVIAESGGMLACRYWCERRDDAALLELIYARPPVSDALVQWVGKVGADRAMLATRGLIPKSYTVANNSD